VNCCGELVNRQWDWETFHACDTFIVHCQFSLPKTCLWFQDNVNQLYDHFFTFFSTYYLLTDVQISRLWALYLNTIKTILHNNTETRTANYSCCGMTTFSLPLILTRYWQTPCSDNYDYQTG
jgi:hypothetical protein